VNRPFSSLLQDMKLPGHRSVVQHWLDLHDSSGGKIPRRRDIDPMQFPVALPDVWIVDAEPGDIFRFHLAGQNMVDWLGRSPKGLAFHDIYPPDRLAFVNMMTKQVLERPAACYHKMESLTRHWSMPIPVERIALPLAGDDGRICHMFGATVFHSRHGHGDGATETQVSLEWWYQIPPATGPHE